MITTKQTEIIKRIPRDADDDIYLVQYAAMGMALLNQLDEDATGITKNFIDRVFVEADKLMAIADGKEPV